jgi:hypothetical protein
MKILIIILCVLIHTIAQAADCSYLPKKSKENPNPELSLHGKCGELIGPDEFQIYPQHLKNLSFKNGLAEVFVGDKVFYISETGKAVRTHLYDNGADYFVEGLARTLWKGKFGYMDQSLNVVIKPEYDFAFPFENGIAVVCKGCRAKGKGEHQSLVGGKWGVIDKSGAIVIPLKQSKAELMKHADYQQLKKKKTE